MNENEKNKDRISNSNAETFPLNITRENGDKCMFMRHDNNY